MKEPALTSPHISGADGTPYLPSLISVLVLDDQRFDRHKINRLCDTLPMACEVSQADCLSAFDVQLNTGAYDLVFLDYNLPDGSGIDALDMIRKSARNSNATSIMVTGFPEDAIEVEAKTRGCADYMTKDELTPSSFERAVTNALQKSALIGEVQVQTFARAEVERVLNLFANQCVTDIKPLVSRLIRQLRDIRETPGENVDQAHQRHERAEASCLHLLDFLKDMEKQHAGVMMKDLFANASYPTKACGLPLSGVSAAKRPPSPFSRRTH